MKHRGGGFLLLAPLVVLVVASCSSGEPESLSFDVDAPQLDVVCGRDAECAIYEPSELTASVGSEITLNFSNSDERFPHNLVVLDDVFEDSFELGLAVAQRDDLVLARTADLVAGETESITVTFDQPGTYQFFCDLPGHFAAGMSGTISVEDS